MATPKISEAFIVIPILGIAILIKVYLFHQYGYVSNDDFFSYLPMADNLITHQLISIDGQTPHVIFPPGYPSILVFFKSLGCANRLLPFANYFIFTTLNALLFILFYRKFISKDIALVTVLSFLYPLFTFSFFTLTTTSEYSFTFFIWLGLYAFFSFLERNTLLSLLLTSFFWAVAYYIRPEALVFFLVGGTILLLERDTIYNKAKSLTILGLCGFVLIFPYLLFLYKATGKIDVSGKNNMALAYELYDTPLELYWNNFIGACKIYLSPNFVNPLLLVGLIGYGYQYKKIGNKNLTYLLLFWAGMSLILLKYLPIARAMYVVLPALIFITAYTLNHWLPKGKVIILLSVGVLTIYCLASTYFPMLFRKNLQSHPFLYAKAGQVIEQQQLDNQLILAREPKITFFVPNSQFIDLTTSTPAKPDWILLSNIQHVSLPTIPSFEQEHLQEKHFRYQEQDFDLFDKVVHKGFYVAIFKARS